MITMPAAFGRAFRRATVPLFWYYAITLGLPLANGAAAAGTPFVTHAIVVLLLPPTLITFAVAATDILRLAAAKTQQLFRSGAHGPSSRGSRIPSSRENR